MMCDGKYDYVIMFDNAMSKLFKDYGIKRSLMGARAEMQTINFWDYRIIQPTYN